VLDEEGRFFHEGERVAHPKLEAAMHTWIAVHPDDGRFILDNGYDWTYFTVKGTPYFVRALRPDATRLLLVLSDGTEEPWAPEQSRSGPGGALVTLVKRHERGGPFEATFSRHAQASLMPVLEEEDGRAWVRVGGGRVLLPSG